jgi:chitinase
MRRLKTVGSTLSIVFFVAACNAGGVSSGQTANPGSSTGGTDSAGGASTVNPATGGSPATGGAPATGTAPVAAAPGAYSANMLFSPYKDVTISANWNTYVISTAVTGTLTPLLTAAPDLKAVVWAFATGECGAETWGGIPGSALASANVPAWSAAKKQYIVSTGGMAGSFTCGSDAGFNTFLERYASDSLVGVDFDIEAGQTADDVANLVARVKAAQTNPKYANLRFSFTIATLGGNNPQSLGPAGITVMAALQKSGLQNYLINLMTMDYGSSSPSTCTLGPAGSCDMGNSAVQAAINLNATYAVPFNRIELTPMIGGNDSIGETFTLQDVATVQTFVKAKGLAGLHIWSLDRDKDCPPGSASPICNSYGAAGPLGFTKAFSGTP